MSGKTPEELGLIGTSDADEDDDSEPSAADDNLKEVMDHLGEVDNKIGEAQNGEDKSEDSEGSKDSESKTEVKTKSGSKARTSKRLEFFFFCRATPCVACFEWNRSVRMDLKHAYSLLRYN